MIFTHVSRTGGTTITNLVRGSLPDCQRLVGQHAPLAAAIPLLGDLFAQSFKFAFVRNPWERFVSWYAMIGLKSGADLTAANVADPESSHWKDFDAFLEKWSAKATVIDGVQRRELSQWAQLVDRDGRLLTDDIGRIETFAADADRLLTKAGIRCSSLPKINSSWHHHYSAYYSAFGRELVEKLFTEDVVHLGYRFEDATSNAALKDKTSNGDQPWRGSVLAPSHWQG